MFLATSFLTPDVGEAERSLNIGIHNVPQDRDSKIHFSLCFKRTCQKGTCYCCKNKAPCQYSIPECEAHCFHNGATGGIEPSPALSHEKAKPWICIREEDHRITRRLVVFSIKITLFFWVFAESCSMSLLCCFSCSSFSTCVNGWALERELEGSVMKAMLSAKSMYFPLNCELLDRGERWICWWGSFEI